MVDQKLTDTQRVLLSHASMQANGAVLPLPRSTKLSGSSVGVVLRSLLKNAFVRERPAGRDEVPWRESDAGERLTLVISDEGCEAIGVTAIGTGPAAAVEPDEPTAPKRQATPTQTSTDRKPEPKEGSKLGLLIAALGKPEGATISELTRVTGWQAHSIRGAMSGALKKARHLSVVSEKVDERGRVYRLSTPSANEGLIDVGGKGSPLPQSEPLLDTPSAEAVR